MTTERLKEYTNDDDKLNEAVHNILTSKFKFEIRQETSKSGKALFLRFSEAGEFNEVNTDVLTTITNELFANIDIDDLISNIIIDSEHDSYKDNDTIITDSINNTKVRLRKTLFNSFMTYIYFDCLSDKERTKFDKIDNFDDISIFSKLYLKQMKKELSKNVNNFISKYWTSSTFTEADKLDELKELHKRCQEKIAHERILSDIANAIKSYEKKQQKQMQPLKSATKKIVNKDLTEILTNQKQLHEEQAKSKTKSKSKEETLEKKDSENKDSENKDSEKKDSEKKDSEKKDSKKKASEKKPSEKKSKKKDKDTEKNEVVSFPSRTKKAPVNPIDSEFSEDEDCNFPGDMTKDEPLIESDNE